MSDDDRELHAQRFDRAQRKRGAGAPRKQDRKRVADTSAPDNATPLEDERPGVVTWVSLRNCRVRSGDQDLACDLSRAGDERGVAVGDRVIAARRDGEWTIVRIEPRGSVLSRPDPHDARKERVLAANVDVVVVVVSVIAPPLHPRLIDRCLVAIQRGGADAVLCVNKVDLFEDTAAREQELATLSPYLELGVPVIPTSVQTGEGLAQLRALTHGRTASFLGHSGVGKSSLVNALHPTLAALTGAVSDANRKGRHTTTAAYLYALGENTQVIDTPGVRAFGLWDVDARTLSLYFGEFAPYAAQCRYGNCTHNHEPQCAVRAASEQSLIAPARYATYLRILASLGENETR